MKNALLKILLIVLAVICPIANAQVSNSGASIAPENQARDLWTDPSTGLSWAGRDNGKDVTWKGALNYCHGLRLGRKNDWRLAMLDELGSIYDPSLNAPGLAGPGKGHPDTWHVKGNIFLTGHQWSANRRMDDRGRPSGYDWWFSFNDGKANNDPSGFFYPYQFMRALCVRGTQIVRPKEGPTLQSIP